MKILQLIEKIAYVVFGYFSYVYLRQEYDLSAFTAAVGGIFAGYLLTLIMFGVFGILLGGAVQLKILRVEQVDKLLKVKRNETGDAIEEDKEEYKDEDIDAPFLKPNKNTDVNASMSSVITSEEIIGTFMDSPIYKWISVKGSNVKYIYETVVHKNATGDYPLPANLPNIFIIFGPGVVYVPENESTEENSERA